MVDLIFIEKYIVGLVVGSTMCLVIHPFAATSPIDASGCSPNKNPKPVQNLDANFLKNLKSQ